MAESKSIPRRSADSDANSFVNLRREGIRLAQALSGELWTDYNLHDPGVTILEQLCYAITELVYRTEFAVADHLTDAQGGIDFESLALHRPEQALCCRPTTATDYRKALLDAVPEIDNLWLTPSGNSPYRGLYEIDVRLAAHHRARSDALLAETTKAVRQAYAANRNVCEDVAEIAVLDDDPCVLRGSIEVHRDRSANRILADIYYACARRIDGSVHLYAFDDEINAHRSLEELFTGPFTPHGAFNADELAEQRGEVQIADLFAIINNVPGVDRINELWVEKDGAPAKDCVQARPGAALLLEIPAARDELKLELTSLGRVLPVSLPAVRSHFDERNYKYRSLRHVRQNLSALYELPSGQHRDLAPYASIQNQFPAIYGINQFGIPESAPEQDKARAAQLKGYLLMFEQLMANYTAQLAGVRKLFSAGSDDGPTYFHQPLSGETVQGLDRVYPQAADEILGDILARYDNRHDRRGRLLDYLLALYGERFSQHSLRTFDVYHGGEDRERKVVANKLNFLRAVVELGRDRAGGMDYSTHAWEGGSAGGLHRRISVLLGFEHTNRMLTAAIDDRNLRLVSHDEYQRVRDSATGELLGFDEIDPAVVAAFENLPPPTDATDAGLDELAAAAGELPPLQDGLLSESLLRGGIHRGAYRLVPTTPDDRWRVMFENRGERQWWNLGDFEHRQQAIEAATALQRFLVGLNTASEGLHMVEHLLLRPQGSGRSGAAAPHDEDHFSFRLTAVLPAWTARCAEPQFRHLAEETVRMNSPAHVYAHFRWLAFERMREFEQLYGQWLEHKAQANTPADTVDETAGELLRILRAETDTLSGAQGH